LPWLVVPERFPLSDLLEELRLPQAVEVRLLRAEHPHQRERLLLHHRLLVVLPALLLRLLHPEDSAVLK
jgi:hypothetical protein